MLPQLLPHYSVGPFFGFAINTMMSLLCLVTLLLYPHYKPLRGLLSFYILSAIFFLGWVIYGLQKTPESILFGYRVDLASLALLPATWAWFQSAISNEEIAPISWVIIGIGIILSPLALFGKGPLFLGFPLTPHEIAVGILRPKSMILRPLIHFYCLAACLIYFIWTIIKINQTKPPRPVYLFFFGIGMALWLSGGLHDALRSAGIRVPIKGQILWFTSLWLSIFLTLTVGFHFRSIDQALREAKEVFEKFVPPAYLKRIASEGIGTIRLGEADRQCVAILCCDIRGFTALSERLSPTELIGLINHLYEKITKVIDKWGGVIDKFLGDGFLSIFEGLNSAQNALKCGIQILSIVKEFNTETLHPSIRVGIGLHMGEVILGTIGSKERMDSTILGPAVNIAKHLEEATKLLEVDMVLSDEIINRLKDKSHRIRRLGEIFIKGITKPFAISEVYDNDPLEIREIKDQVAPLVSEAIEYFKSGLFDQALSKLEQSKRVFPQDKAIDLMINSLRDNLCKEENIKTKILIGLHFPQFKNP